jgi:triosephosphate isomerase (TIM)
MRKPFIAANWKMHKTIPETKEFISVFIPLVKDVQHVTIVIAPPFTSLASVATELKSTNILLAAQNMFFEEKGAYTGEISPVMLADIGCPYVIVGHSERRQYFFETDDVVNKKIRAAQKQGLGLIVCIGESLTEREARKTFEILQRQLERGLNETDPEDVIIAYEPVWAIGTGKTASPEQAQEAHAFIRGILKTFYGKKAEELCIIYGGSVTPENVDSLMNCTDVDGALVGGASLKPESFARIVKFVKKS